MPVVALEGLAKDAQCLLTARERNVVSRIKHARRRSESVAGRLLAKWLVLRQMAGIADGQREDAWPPEMHDLTSGDVDALSEGDCGSLEILPGDGGAPRLGFCEGARADMVRVSIAHRGGWAAAAVSGSAPIGVDLEVVAPRGQLFYDECLSDCERQWLGRGPPALTERLATLLWAVKEACFKTGESMATSVWGIGAIDLGIRTPTAHVARSMANRDSTRLQLLDLDVTVRPTGLQPRVAYGATETFALAVMALVRAA